MLRGLRVPVSLKQVFYCVCVLKHHENEKNSFIINDCGILHQSFCALIFCTSTWKPKDVINQLQIKLVHTCKLNIILEKEKNDRKKKAVVCSEHPKIIFVWSFGEYTRVAVKAYLSYQSMLQRRLHRFADLWRSAFKNAHQHLSI